MKFKCDGNPYDTIEEAGSAEVFITEECGNELTVSERTGMGHVGVIGSEIWCDECGEHYTAAESRAKARLSGDSE